MGVMIDPFFISATEEAFDDEFYWNVSAMNYPFFNLYQSKHMARRIY